MSDQYTAIRSIALPTVFGWLGVDLSQFKTRKGGKEFYGKCFFHGAKGNNTSLSFTADLAHCFSCNTKFRGAIDAVKLYRNCGFKEAVAWLEERSASQPSPDTKTPPVEADIASGEVLRPLEKDSWRKFAVPCPWLEERVPDASVRERYGVFQYRNPSRRSVYTDRIMVSIRDMTGELFGYLGRAVEGEPKYLWPKNLPKSKFVFGGYELGKSFQLPVRYVLVVESPWA